MQVSHPAVPGATYRIVPVNSYAARIACNRQVITDRNGVRWNTGANRLSGPVREPIAWLFNESDECDER